MDHEPAAPGPIAFHPDLSAVGFDDVLHDGEAESRAAQFARAGFVHSVESLKHSRSVRFRNPDAGVGDDDLDHRAG